MALHQTFHSLAGKFSGFYQSLKKPKIRARLARLLPGRVSRLHYHEARERYFSLLRTVQYKLKVQGGEMDACRVALEDCLDILEADRALLTRRQGDLNRLWRSMTRIRNLLMEHVFEPDRLLMELDFCREEAYRLRVEDDPAVRALVERIAELVDEVNELPPEREKALRRALRATYERFNSIRTSRILQQYMGIRTYQFALLFLIPIALLVISNHRVVLRNWPLDPPQAADGAPAPGEAFVSADSEAGAPALQTHAVVPDRGAALQNGGMEAAMSEQEPDRAGTDAVSSGWLGALWARLLAFARTIGGYFGTNILAFVFFGGLVGGFFSAVMRLRGRTMVPGDDAYFVWYVLTKPFVGAVGAVLLYILLIGGLVNVEIVGQLQSLEPDSRIFGFAILAGFSERIVFPGLQ